MSVQALMALDPGYDGNSFRMPDVLEREQVARGQVRLRVVRLGSEHAIRYLQLRIRPEADVAKKQTPHQNQELQGDRPP
jgi:hypothetical protein